MVVTSCITTGDWHEEIGSKGAGRGSRGKYKYVMSIVKLQQNKRTKHDFTSRMKMSFLIFNLRSVGRHKT